MIFIQRKGPFNEALNFAPTTPVKLRYLQIGIEHPHSIPLSEIEDDSSFPFFSGETRSYPFVCRINGDSYLITERDVLEFSNLTLASFSITFVDPSDPYLIVNVSYEEDAD